LIENAKSFRDAHRGVMPSKSVVGDRVKRSARHALYSLVSPRRAYSPDNFSRRSAGEGQQQYSFGGDLALKQELHSRAQRGGLTGARPRKYAKRTVAKRRRLALAIVQMLL
jgi:hypothetical protein